MPRQKKTTTKIEKSSPSKKLIIEFLGEMGGVSSEVEIVKSFLIPAFLDL